MRHGSFKTLKLADGYLKLREERIPSHADEPQLIIKPKLVGICRSDIKEFLGTRTIRHDFGHEILGEVVASNRSELPRVGTLVVLDPHIKIKRTSGFGELIVATASINALLKAFISVSPAAAHNDRLVFVEPLACAHHCVSNLLRFINRERLDGLSIGIVGAGMTGTLIGLLCKYYGASVTIINRSRERLNFLTSTRIFDASELDLSQNIEREFDVIIPTTTFLFPGVLKFCEKVVKDSGLLLLYGGTKAGDTFPGVDTADIDDVRRSQRLLTITTPGKSIGLCGTHGATTNDFKAAVKLLQNSPRDFPVERLVGRKIKLEEVPEMIVMMTKEEILGKTIVGF